MALDYSSPYSDDLGPQPGLNLIPGYSPFICDMAHDSRPDPLPISHRDLRSEEEVDRIRHSLRREVSSKQFDHPIALADFCLVAPAKWEGSESSEEERSSKYCILLYLLFPGKPHLYSPLLQLVNRNSVGRAKESPRYGQKTG
jgi:hypothetical protein